FSLALFSSSHSNFAGGITIQVEELAFLIRDNLRSKHLVLAMEDTFVNFLQHDTSSDGVLELEPMDPYNRLLLHRLADIFGYSLTSHIISSAD
ncbi:hypothetical protein LINPERHAP2_LOCUS18740, partial [Linum perenne]